jgi:hypothetical protein
VGLKRIKKGQPLIVLDLIISEADLNNPRASGRNKINKMHVLKTL